MPSAVVCNSNGNIKSAGGHLLALLLLFAHLTVLSFSFLPLKKIIIYLDSGKTERSLKQQNKL